MIAATHKILRTVYFKNKPIREKVPHIPSSTTVINCIEDILRFTDPPVLPILQISAMLGSLTSPLSW